MLKFEVEPEKVVNAVAFFAARCPRVTKMKICKLLYFADKEHLLRYGRPITGDSYIRMDWGPTPSVGLNMMRGLSSSRVTALFQSKLAVHGNEVRLLSSPDTRVFSNSDIRIMEEICEKYGSLTAAQLSALSHREASWKKTAENQLIDFELLFEGRPDAELTLELLKDEADAPAAEPHRGEPAKTRT